MKLESVLPDIVNTPRQQKRIRNAKRKFKWQSPEQAQQAVLQQLVNASNADST